MKRRTGWLVGWTVLAAALLLPGCRKAVPTTAAPAPAPVAVATAPAAQLGGAKLPGHAQTIMRRGMERQEAQNQLRQIGIFYQTYKDEQGRYPARLEDFLEYIKRDATREYTSLQTGYFTLNLKGTPTPDTLLAYETEPYNDGSRLVLMGDRSAVKIMSDADFQAALKAGGG